MARCPDAQVRTVSLQGAYAFSKSITEGGEKDIEAGPVGLGRSNAEFRTSEPPEEDAGVDLSEMILRKDAVRAPQTKSERDEQWWRPCTEI